MKLNKKVTIFGKQMSVVAIALLAMAGLASAGLLSYYGMITGTATVKQSLVISSDGAAWKECTGGDVTACTLLPYSITATAGNTQDFTGDGYNFYLKNNANGYVYFKEEFIIPTNLFDGMTNWDMHYTTYTGATPGKECDKTTGNLTIGIRTILAGSPTKCSDVSCSLLVGDKTITVFNDTTLKQIVITTTDKLGEGFTQKFCGTTIGLNPATIPDTYTVNINILPA